LQEASLKNTKGVDEKALATSVETAMRIRGTLSLELMEDSRKMDTLAKMFRHMNLLETNFNFSN